MKANQKNPGSLGGEMRMRVKEHCKTKSNHTKSNYMRACKQFDQWRKEAGLSNKAVREKPREAVEQWRDHLLSKNVAQSSVHTSIAGICCGLGIEMTGITRHGTSEEKRKSLGNSERARAARAKKSNADIVLFQEMVGGRRTAIARLSGADFVRDEAGEWCVRFIRDKGGKTQLQRIAPEHVAEVRAYFEAVGPDELLFPDPIDKDLDLHGIRAEHARREYERYVQICATPEGREKLRAQLWARYTDPEIGCKAYLIAKEKGDKEKIRKLERKFSGELKDSKYYLRGANRRVALARGLPTDYDRLALMAVSVFALSHWRPDVSIANYFL